MRFVIAMILFGVGFAVIAGCGNSASTDEGLKGPPPPVVQPEPGMKAPEDRPGMSKDGGAAGAG